MPMPANVTTVVVAGTFLTPEGNPSTGTVTFTPSSWLLNSGANVSIPNSAVSKTLGTAGDFTVTLPITDDTDLSPANWVYSVSEVVDGVSQSYNVLIPGTVAAGGTVFLADLAPVAAAGPEYYSLASSLAIGTVTTVATGGSATATITGLAPSQVLNLGIPTGATGTVSTAGSGSAGTAALAPQGDSNTGLFFPAADTVAITTGGTERLRVNSSGNVGIGTTGPGTILHTSVNGAGSIQLMDGAAAANEIRFRRYNTTVASPTVVAQNDTLGAISFQGYDGSQIRSAAQISGIVNATPGASDMPGALLFSTTADGSATLTERMRIDSNGLITGTGTSLGAWTAYTPTLGNTWAIGNGTVAGFYCQVGKTVAFRALITLGSTSTFGSASPTVTLPVTAKAANLGAFNAYFSDSSLGAIYQGAPWMSTTSVVAVRVLGASGAHGTTNSTTPFTWADADALIVTGVYEIA